MWSELGSGVGVASWVLGSEGSGQATESTEDLSVAVPGVSPLWPGPCVLLVWQRDSFWGLVSPADTGQGVSVTALLLRARRWCVTGTVSDQLLPLK